MDYRLPGPLETTHEGAHREGAAVVKDQPPVMAWMIPSVRNSGGILSRTDNPYQNGEQTLCKQEFTPGSRNPVADSLRDQLVKAGLATSGQAKKAERQKRAEEQARRHGAGGKTAKSRPTDPSSAADAKKRARALNAEKTARDRAIAASRNEKNAAKALRAEIKQIILQNDQRASEARDDDVPYNFVHGKKIKRIYVPRAQQQQLGTGSLVIVNNDGRYHLVSKEVAERIRARDPKRIIAAHDPAKQSTADDEYYARFEIPDDLDW